MNARRRFSRLFCALAQTGIGIALGLGVSGCGSDGPVNPVGGVTPIVASQLQFAAARIGVADAATRLAPAMARLVGDGALDNALLAIANAVDQQDARALQSGLDNADRAIAKLTTADDGSVTADLDVLRMSLADARLLIAQSPASSVAATTP